MCSREYCRRRSINLRFFVAAVFWAMAIDAWLSMKRGVDVDCWRPRKRSLRLSHCVVWTAAVADTYSALQVDKACIFCFVDVHMMGLALKRCTAPEIDFQSSLSPASAYEWSGWAGILVSRINAVSDGTAEKG